MFWRVALITFANVLVKNQILLKNKQMICRHLTFTFPEHPLRVFFLSESVGGLCYSASLQKKKCYSFHGPDCWQVYLQID